jgi:putative ATPase
MKQQSNRQPLADRLRPQSLAEFSGQQHLVGEGKPLQRMIESGQLHSMILWGPPGVGKTTLAHILAKQTGYRFFALSAVSASKNDVRAVIDEATPKGPVQVGLFDAPATENTRGAVLFLDEIHRFNKAQQDFLLPYVEDGTVILIGATTENPSFEVISALLSRARVYVLESLSEADILQLLERGAAALNVTVEPEALAFIAAYVSGDARQSLNLLEGVAALYGRNGTATLTLTHVKDALQSKHLRYDQGGEEHYNTISAYIKSMRAGQTDAALYYLARMVAAGEDALFIARRMVIFASEDVGLADPHALTVANAVFQACSQVGYPEAQINLAHGTAYMAQAGKSRAAYEAYFRALDDVQKRGNLPIPMHLRNAPTALMRELGYGKGDAEAAFLPEALKNKRYME